MLIGTILQRICEIGVQNKINMTEYESLPQFKLGLEGGGAVYTTGTMVWLIYMKNMEGGDTEQFGNVQESERYVIHVVGQNNLTYILRKILNKI